MQRLSNKHQSVHVCKIPVVVAVVVVVDWACCFCVTGDEAAERFQDELVASLENKFQAIMAKVSENIMSQMDGMPDGRVS
jgi:uncharacterized protein CbrC (UPF0167 family)